MKLEDQVCSLILAKRLKELGVKQESLFYWHNNKAIVNPNQRWAVLEKSIDCSAFTVAELGEMLPDGFRSGKLSSQFLCMVPNDNGTLESTVRLKEFDIRKEADARAKMLCHLIEEGIVKP